MFVVTLNNSTLYF